MSVAKKGAAIVAIGWAGIPIGLVTAVIVARVLGVEGKGVLFLIDGLQVALTAVFGLGLPAAASFLVKDGKWPFREIVWSVLLLTFTSSLLAGALVFGATQWVLQMAAANAATVDPAILWVVVLSQPLVMAGVVFEVLMVVEGNMKLFALKSLAPVVITALLTVLLVVVYPLGILGAVIAQAAGFVSQFLFSLIYVSTKTPLGRPMYRPKLAIEMLRIGLPQAGNSVLSVTSKRLDGWLVTAVLGIGAAGLYSVASNFQNLFGAIPRSLLWPLVGDLHGSQGEARVRKLAKATRIQNVLGVVACLVLMPVVALIIPLLFGERFAGSVPAAMAAVAFLAILPVQVSINALFVSMGKPGWINGPLACGVVAQYLVALVTLPKIGILGAGLAILVCHTIFGLLLAVKAAKVTGVPAGEFYLPRGADFKEIWSRLTSMRAPRGANQPAQPSR